MTARLARLAAFQNPEFYRAQSMRLSKLCERRRGLAYMLKPLNCSVVVLRLASVAPSMVAHRPFKVSNFAQTPLSKRRSAVASACRRRAPIIQADSPVQIGH